MTEQGVPSGGDSGSGVRNRLGRPRRSRRKHDRCIRMGNMGRRCASRLGFSIQQTSQIVLPKDFSWHIQETNHRRGMAYGHDVIHPRALERAKQGSRTMSSVDDHDAGSDPPHRVDHGEQVSSRWNQDRDPIARADSPAREGVGELGNTTLECPPRHISERIDISERIGLWRCFRRYSRICT